MNITVAITFYFGSGGFKRGEPGGAMPPPPFFDFFLSFFFFIFYFFTKAKFTSKKSVLDEYEICLKMLEMAILETQNFKTFWTPLENLCLWRSWCPSPFESPGSAPVCVSLPQTADLNELVCLLQY